MKQTIEIEVPDVYKAVYDEEPQEVEIVSATLPKTWEEFCGETPINDTEYLIDNYSDVKEVLGNVKRDTETDKNMIQSKETAEAFLALMQLVRLRDYYRPGWKPDWDQPYKKYCIYCNGNSVYVFDCIYSSRVLSFQSKEIRDEFLKNFKDLIEQAKELI